VNLCNEGVSECSWKNISGQVVQWTQMSHGTTSLSIDSIRQRSMLI